jgi:hypothetical protein
MMAFYGETSATRPIDGRIGRVYDDEDTQLLFYFAWQSMRVSLG